MIKQFVIAAFLASAALLASDGQASARTLSDAEAANLEGGAVTLTLPMLPDDELGQIGEGEGEGEAWNHSDWWAKCVTDKYCSDTAELHNGLGCPTSYQSLGGVGTYCQPKRCVLSCSNDVVAELCKDDWFWDCYYIDDPDALPSCGTGTTGTCPYSTTWHDGLNVKTCNLAGGCTPDGRTIECGTAHKCYSVD